MWHYAPPLRDIRFVTEELLNLPAHWATLPAHAELDVDTARQVIEEAGKFAADVVAPLNAVGDLEGCTLRDGEVKTPRGYREAYQAFVGAGWPALACDPAVGGQGLPHAINAVLHEMLNSANHAWNMYPGLLHGARGYCGVRQVRCEQPAADRVVMRVRRIERARECGVRLGRAAVEEREQALNLLRHDGGERHAREQPVGAQFAEHPCRVLGLPPQRRHQAACRLHSQPDDPLPRLLGERESLAGLLAGPIELTEVHPRPTARK
jgi:hypothetical protein